MYVDGRGPYSGVAPGRFQRLDLEHPLFIGGVPSLDHVSSLAGFRQGFVGEFKKEAFEKAIQKQKLPRKSMLVADLEPLK